MNKLFFIIPLCSFLIWGCKSTKQTKQKADQLSVADFNKKLLPSQFQFESFSAKAKINYVSGTTNQTFNASFRIRKDSAIWASLSLFGIEGARALITKDSVKIIDRLNKTYIAKDFKYIESKLGLPSANFETLQKLLVGNLVFYDPSKVTLAIDSGAYIAISTYENYQNTLKVNPTDFAVVSSFIEDLIYNQKINILYQNYNPVGNQSFPFYHFITVEKGIFSSSLAIDYSKVDINEPLSFPFNVSDKYEIMR